LWCWRPVPGGPISIDVCLHPDDEIGWLPLLEDFDLRPGDQERRRLAGLR
jgi:hypothetical protein